MPGPPQPVAPNRTANPAGPQFAVQPAQALDGGDELTPEERVNVAVYENCNKSVVNINTMATNTNLFLLDVVSEGAGSGSVLDRQGHILTNYHVVEGAREIQVTLFDSKSYPAKLIAKDASTDVAILQIDAPPESLFPVRFGDSTRLKVGQRIFRHRQSVRAGAHHDHGSHFQFESHAAGEREPQQIVHSNRCRH